MLGGDGEDGRSHFYFPSQDAVGAAGGAAAGAVHREAVLEHQDDGARGGDVAQRIACHEHKVGAGAGGDPAAIARPEVCAGPSVAARNASAGQSPARVSNCNSPCKLAPEAPRLGASVPARMRTPAA